MEYYNVFKVERKYADRFFGEANNFESSFSLKTISQLYTEYVLNGFILNIFLIKKWKNCE